MCPLGRDHRGLAVQSCGGWAHSPVRVGAQEWRGARGGARAQSLGDRDLHMPWGSRGVHGLGRGGCITLWGVGTRSSKGWVLSRMWGREGRGGMRKRVRCHSCGGNCTFERQALPLMCTPLRYVLRSGMPEPATRGANEVTR